MAQRDYLVIYEEPDEDGLPSDDSLVLDIEASRAPTLGELDVEQDLDLELTNKTNWFGTLGFAVALLGGLLGAVLMAFFASYYPVDWYGAPPQRIRTMILLSVLALAFMITGTILTHYGRRIQARGNLSAVRIVEKLPQNRARLG